MATAIALRPAKKFGPGYFIREQMEYRNWNQEDLAEVIGITLKHVNKILQDKQPITLEMAKVLSEVFETSPQYWLNLDANYRLWLESEKSEKEIQADIKGKIYERMPIRDMVNKKWLPGFSTSNQLEESILKYWEMETLDFTALDQKAMPLLARKSERMNQYNAAYTYTWYQKALLTAKQYKVRAYDKDILLSLCKLLHIFTNMDNGINLFLRDLKSAGVIFFVLPHLQKTYLDGAAFFVEGTPVIVFTGRYKRIDNFWFTLAHEIGHILNHFDSPETFFVDNFKEDEKNELENEANLFASDLLKHNDITRFLQPKLNYLSRKTIVDCADSLQIHPSIIIGKLMHDKTISYANQTLFNDNVLEKIDNQYIPSFL